MARKGPWNSKIQSVHHVCTTGNNIEPENLQQGTGNKPLCKECESLINRGDC